MDFSKKHNSAGGFFRGLSRCAVIGEVGQEKIDPKTSKALANSLCKEYGEQIKEEIETTLKDLKAYNISIIQRHIPVVEIARDGSPKIGWPVYKLFLPTGQKEDEYYQISTSFVIVVCNRIWSSKLWVTSRLNALYVKEDSQYKIKQTEFDVEQIGVYLVDIQKVAEQVCRAAWPSYKTATEEVLDSTTTHTAWLNFEGATIGRSIVDQELQGLKGTPEQKVAEIKKSESYHNFLNEFYVHIAKLHTKDLNKKKILDFERDKPVDSYRIREDAAYFTLAPPLEKSYKSIEKKEEFVTAFRLIGLASCMYSGFYGSDYDPMLISTRESTQRYSKKF